MLPRCISKGCRHLEIDCWDGLRNPMVKHGNTFTTTVPFVEVAKAVAECAFLTVDLPVLLSLEVCPARLQPAARGLLPSCRVPGVVCSIGGRCTVVQSSSASWR